MQLVNIRSNFHRISLGFIDIYFSYETPIAFNYEGELVISNNEWGPTTGKHLNEVNPDKSLRIPNGDLQKQLQEVIRGRVSS